MDIRDLNQTKQLVNGIENGTIDSTGIQVEFSELTAGGKSWWVPKEECNIIKVPTVYNTTIEVKQQYFKKFADLIESQFKHGGNKYKLQGFEDREATDVISSIFGGKSEFDWILGTMMKYILRFKNFEREKDLLKIATYCYILWLKQGNHLKEINDEDAQVYKKDK